MRVLFSTQCGAGHWRPLVPVAQALQAAGHAVAFATTSFGCTDISGHGFQCFPAGIDDWRQPPPKREGIPPRKGPPQATAVWPDVFVDIRAAHAIPDLLAICGHWHPDLVVREMTEFGACVVAARLGLPHATVQVGAYRPDLERSIVQALDRQRGLIGLPPDPALAALYPYLLLTPVPPRLQHPRHILPATTHALRWESFDAETGTAAELPGWLEHLPIRPTVYATLGTAYNRTPGIFAAILAGLREAPLNVIVTLGPNLDPADFGEQPAHIRLERYIPQSLIVPMCDAVIAHGGFSTTLATIAAGLPLVFIPIAADMFDNARRCVALGAAVSIQPDERTPEAILAAVQTVLGHPTYRRNAEHLRDEMLTLPGPAHAVTLLERLAREKQPILSS